MTDAKTKLIYIAALPYSGSTIFSIALGNSPRMLNIGEYKFIENDWNDSSLCYCQKTLSECSFWKRVVNAEEFQSNGHPPSLQLNNQSTFRYLDSRKLPIFKRLLADIGVPLTTIFGRRYIRNYVDGTATFARFLSREFEVGYIVDASKSLRRLEALRLHSDIDIKVIILRRNGYDLLASRLKRAKKRNPMYSSIVSPIYFLWLLYHVVRVNALTRRIPPKDCLEVTYEEFCDTPKALEQKISQWLGVPVDFDIDDCGVINTENCHIFTGNVGITKDSGRENGIALRKTSSSLPGSSLIERAMLRLVARM